jgi:hypothetical protein
MSNVDDLKYFLAGRKVGDVVEVADSTTAPGHRFDFYSTAPAVRSLIKQGYVKGDNLWRYYELKILRIPTNQ